MISEFSEFGKFKPFRRVHEACFVLIVAYAELGISAAHYALGSYMEMTGVSLSVIGNALNHKDVSTTRKVYAHSAKEAELAAREVAHKAMFGLAESRSKGRVIRWSGGNW